MTWRIAAVVLIAGMFISAAARANDWRDGLNLADADLSSFRMIVVNEGIEVGAMEYGWTRIGDRYLVEYRTHMAPNILETASALIDGHTYLPHNVAIKYTRGDNLMNVDLRWVDGVRQGQIMRRNLGEDERVDEIHHADDNDAPLRMSVFGLVTALPLKDRFAAKLNWYNAIENRTEQIDVRTNGRARVKVPAGVYDTYRVEVRGASPENIMYVSMKKPRQIIRVDMLGRDTYFLRVEG